MIDSLAAEYCFILFTTNDNVSSRKSAKSVSRLSWILFEIFFFFTYLAAFCEVKICGLMLQLPFTELHHVAGTGATRL